MIWIIGLKLLFTAHPPQHSNGSHSRVLSGLDIVFGVTDKIAALSFSVEHIKHMVRAGWIRFKWKLLSRTNGDIDIVIKELIH